MRPQYQSKISLSIVVIVLVVVVVCVSQLIYSEITTRAPKSRKPSKTTIDLSHIVDLELEHLPEEFQSSMLPGEPNEGFEYETLGRIKHLPIPLLTTEPTGPLAMNMVFYVYKQEHSNVVDDQSSFVEIPFDFVWNHNKNGDEHREYPFDLSLLINTINAHAKTYFIVGGFLDLAPRQWQLEMARHLHMAETSDINTIIVGWNGGNQWPYPRAVANTRMVARQMSMFLYYLAKVNDLDPNGKQFLDKIHLIGHSLGAHICAFVGQDFAGSLGRITGLDPAGPLFNTIDPDYRLDPTDARVVVAIHSNTYHVSSIYYGIKRHVGHLDFYPNGGSNQPGCPVDPLLKFHHEIVREQFINMIDHEFYSKRSGAIGYRLLTFPANFDSYDDFRKGTSFIEACPELALNMDYFPMTLDGPDSGDQLNKCSLPLDILSSPDELLSLLSEKYNMNLDRLNSMQDNNDNSHNNGKEHQEGSGTNEPEPSKSLYYYTIAEHPLIADHQLFKMQFDGLDRLAKLEAGTISSSKNEPTIDQLSYTLWLRFKMANGKRELKTIDDYKLHLNNGNYNAVLPINTILGSAQRELIELESNNWFQGFELRRMQAFETIFPQSIAITLSRNNNAKVIMRSVSSKFRDWLFRATGRTRKSEYPCQAIASGVRLHPLTVLNRSLVAIYTTKKEDSETRRPNIIQMEDSKQSLPRIPFGQVELECLSNTSSEMNVKVYLDTILIGPKRVNERSVSVEEAEIPGAR